eukprot:249118-Prymnesium_polylepis.2
MQVRTETVAVVPRRCEHMCRVVQSPMQLGRSPVAEGFPSEHAGVVASQVKRPFRSARKQDDARRFAPSRPIRPPRRFDVQHGKRPNEFNGTALALRTAIGGRMRTASRTRIVEVAKPACSRNERTPASTAMR